MNETKPKCKASEMAERDSVFGRLRQSQCHCFTYPQGVFLRDQSAEFELSSFSDGSFFKFSSMAAVDRSRSNRTFNSIQGAENSALDFTACRQFSLGSSSDSVFQVTNPLAGAGTTAVSRSSEEFC